MATVRFLSPTFDRVVTIAVPPGEARTLLAVARENDVAIPYSCETGECSACLVHVETRDPGLRPVAPLAGREASLLTSMCYLTDSEIAVAASQGVSPNVRLACQYELQDETIDVFIDDPLADG